VQPPPAFTITQYSRRHRADVRDLLQRHYYSHIHLDWHDVEHWLESEHAPIRLAWDGRDLVGVLAMSAPLHDAVWVRLAGAADHYDAHAILSALWDDLLPELRVLRVKQAAMLMIRDWAIRYLEPLGFRFLEQIITLRRSDRTPPPLAQISGVTVRISREGDLDAITMVDQCAFLPPWQMTHHDLRQAERSAANCTVAVETDTHRVIGYQISTLYFDGAHLARLAVDPAFQGRGIGRALLSGVLNSFARRGTFAMTVNTQESNLHSQQLYTSVGFARNSYDLPVYHIEIT
jgi:[ribosomal protein S18]-alanine N-acetyltransferase